MVTERAVTTTEEKTHEVEKPQSRAIRPMLTESAIASITYDLKMAEKLVTEALEEGIDFGEIEGVPGKGLWDPGSSKIMNAFQCYPRHRVLFHEENENVITWALEAEIISRETGQIVGSGVGACSTREPKYKYRWVSKEEAQRLGYTEPEINQMKTKKRKRYEDKKPVADVTEYRVENPEYGEQVNTLLQMAAKRAETDGSKTLPGVASALRKLFSTQKQTQKGGKQDVPTEDSPRWTSYWNSIRDILGDDYQNRAYKILGVPDMHTWLKRGKSLDDAVKVVSAWAEKHKAKRRDPATVMVTHVQTTGDLIQMMSDCFGWPEERVWAEANYRDRKNFEEAGVETPWVVFKRLADFVKQQGEAPTED